MRPLVRAQLDYYSVLEIHASADTAAVNAAFRRLAWRYHPDRNPAPDATLQFQDINEAHQVLSDPMRRAEYDAKWYPKPAESHRATHPYRPQRSRPRWPRHNHTRKVMMAIIALMIISSAWTVIYTSMSIAHSGGFSFPDEARAASLGDAAYSCSYSLELVPLITIDERGRRSVTWEANMQNCYGGATRISAGRPFSTLPQARTLDGTVVP
jgi:curved DNA-binding protein CbpA